MLRTPPGSTRAVRIQRRFVPIHRHSPVASYATTLSGNSSEDREREKTERSGGEREIELSGNSSEEREEREEGREREREIELSGNSSEGDYDSL